MKRKENQYHDKARAVRAQKDCETNMDGGDGGSSVELVRRKKGRKAAEEKKKGRSARAIAGPIHAKGP